jgi:peptidoglycan hydrolase-like amidase
MLLAVLVQVHILALLHPHAALVWPDGAAQPQAVQVGERYGIRRFAVQVAGLPRREYAGTLEVRPGNGELDLVDVVELEDYAASVAGSELGLRAPQAALEAVGVVARSFALSRLRANGAKAAPGPLRLSGLPAHDGALCDTTHCQLYLGTSRAAHLALRELLISSDGAAAPALHFASCGGTTASAQSVWPRAGPADREAGVAVSDGCPPDRRSAEPATGTLTTDGRISRGRGRGHGVGLCQEGAIRLATKGLPVHLILSRYFPRLRMQRVP